MAVTKRADITAQIGDLWSTRLFYQAVKKTFWYKYEGGEGSNSPIVRKDDLEAKPGTDTLFMDIALNLTGAGATGDTALLEGNEEQVKFRQASITIDSLQHAVRWSKLGKILINHDMRKTAENLLRKHLAGRLDDQVFNELTGGTGATIAEASLPTTMKWFAGSATAISGIADTAGAGKLELTDISNIKAYAVNNNFVEPLEMGDSYTGEEMYGLVVDPYAALALKLSSAWQQAQRDAQTRGETNPLFKGSIGVWDNVAIFLSNRVRTANDGSGSIRVARNVFFGAQALARAYVSYPDWSEQYFSYGQEQGIAYWTALGVKMLVFDLNSSETPGTTTDDTAIGSMILYSAAVAPTA
jgi:N4-gp56 family major capsid protein